MKNLPSCSKFLPLAASLVLAMTASAIADVVPVVNGGFDVTNPSSSAPFVLGSSPSGYIISNSFGTDQTFSYGTGSSGPTSGDITGWVGTQLTSGGYAQDVQFPTNIVGTGTSSGFTADFEEESISQTLTSDLQADSTYSLNFAAAYREDQGNHSGANFTADLYAGSTELATVSGSDSPTLSSTFQNFTFTYDDASVSPSLIGEPLTITFSNNQPGGAAQVLVDNVSLDVEGPSTPEPSTFALMLAGLGTLVMVARMRRRNA